MQRLSSATVNNLTDTTLPRYDRHTLKAGIVHIGVGAFHRAHQAVYTDDVLNQQGGDWGIVGASLRSADVRDRLAPQDYLYTVCSRSADGSSRRVIGAITSILVTTDATARETLLDTIASPEIKVITLTITEQGYCYDPVQSTLAVAHADIAHDLASPGDPRSAPGILCEGLRRRMHASAGPISIVSCDNLVANGKVLCAVVTEFAQHIDPKLADWIDANAAFPCSMVDRIVPQITNDELEQANKQQDLVDPLFDRALVICEPFSQWVIEDAFAAERPQWEIAGALLVADVEPYETAKLRLLNGAHSACAYLGRVAGYEYVHQAIANPLIRQCVSNLMALEVTPTLAPLPGIDLDDYKQTILSRFANDAIRYKTEQVATDGSTKLPQRILPTIRDRLATGDSIDALSLTIAAWMRFLGGVDDASNSFTVLDPMAESLQAMVKNNHDIPARVEALLSVDAIFGELTNNKALLDQVCNWLSRLETNGVANTLESL